MLSLMMVDIDFFKNYNDTYGHCTGDNCLISIAAALTKNMAREGDFVARYGGEEFAVVMPNTGEDGARFLADKLLESIRKLAILHENSNVAHFVTISIGVTTGSVRYTQKAMDYVNTADKALYMSKQSGRNRYTFIGFEDITNNQ
jgi:diguanylate cyclase (GGDEF)-like protein